MTTELPSDSAGDAASRLARNSSERSETHGNVFLADGSGSQEKDHENGTRIGLSRSRDASLAANVVHQNGTAGQHDRLPNPEAGDGAAGEKTMASKSDDVKNKGTVRRVRSPAPLSVYLRPSIRRAVEKSARTNNRKLSPEIEFQLCKALGLSDLGNNVAVG